MQTIINVHLGIAIALVAWMMIAWLRARGRERRAEVLMRVHARADARRRCTR